MDPNSQNNGGMTNPTPATDTTGMGQPAADPIQTPPAPAPDTTGTPAPEPMGQPMEAPTAPTDQPAGTPAANEQPTAPAGDGTTGQSM